MELQTQLKELSPYTLLQVKMEVVQLAHPVVQIHVATIVLENVLNRVRMIVLKVAKRIAVVLV